MVDKKKVLCSLLVLFGIVIFTFIVYSVVNMFSISHKTVNGVLSSAKDNVKKNNYLMYEDSLHSYAMLYVQKHEIVNDLVLTADELVNIGMEGLPSTCDGYVLYDADAKTFDAYISCEDYTTNGYNKDFIK